MLKKICFFFLTLGSFTAIFAQQAEIQNIRTHITYLASDELKGRGTGTAEQDSAANYIARQFAKIGLKPKGEEGFFQTFVSSPVHSTRRDISIRNVVGFLDYGKANTIIIGAHYDHLGLGADQNSREMKPEGMIHNGADDNASGVAGVLELARMVQSSGKSWNYNFLFICFSGEELGLLGSAYYANHPTITLADADCMINMDMIGRLTDKKMEISGVGTSDVWIPMLNELNKNFVFTYDSAGVGASDHTSFYLKDIPSIHFFTGGHSDYHKTTDDVDKINFEGEKEVLDFMYQALVKIDAMPKLKFLKTKEKNTATNPAFKVTLGIMPDYMYNEGGVRADGVTEGKPGFKAGMKTGDIVLQLGKYPVKDIYAYMDALSKFQKGDKTTLVVKRNGKKVKLKVVF